MEEAALVSVGVAEAANHGLLELEERGKWPFSHKFFLKNHYLVPHRSHPRLSAALSPLLLLPSRGGSRPAAAAGGRRHAAPGVLHPARGAAAAAVETAAAAAAARPRWRPAAASVRAQGGRQGDLRFKIFLNVG